MSCQIRTISAIQNVKQIRKLLFPGWDDKEETSGDWQQFDWNWRREEESDDSKLDDWLQNCLISISPIGDVLVIANEDTAVFLTLKWDGYSEEGTKEKFVVNGTESLPSTEELDCITCILCLPLASQKRSSYGRPDWTAVIIGTRLGFVRVYTENGILLVSQKFHEEPITAIKCRTFNPHICAALAEQQEELTVLYKTAIVTVDGFSLYQTLRACRNQVAKATARGSEAVAPPPIAYKKWGFQDQELICDCESIGVTYTNIFDNLMNESVKRGFHGHPKLISSAASLFITTGQSPYASFYFAVEGTAPFFMKDVALAAASKLKSVITGFFGSSKASSEKSVPKIEPATPLPNRFELKDPSRLGERIFTSPNRRLSAVTDEFGRVILIDNLEGIAVRIWKGYRDAQCGWIEVVEDAMENVEEKDRSPSHPRIAHFFVIYGPRRGILEAWAIQQGPRVTAFNVGKLSRLMYCNHGILGLNNVKSVVDSRLQTRNCYFLDSDGLVKTISIPFHYALSAKYSRRVRDLHLVNNLKALFKTTTERSGTFVEEVSNIILDIKTTSIIMQALEVILNDKSVTSSLLKFVIVKLKDSFAVQEPDSLDFESKLLYFNCIRQLQLIEFYDNIKQLGNSQICLDDGKEMKPLKILSGIFNVSETEADLILSRVDKFFNLCQSKKSVKFECDSLMSVGPFILCFQTYCTHLANFTTFNDIALPLPIGLSEATTEKCLNVLACTVFDFIFQSRFEIEKIQSILLPSGIEMKIFLNLLLKCWLQTEKYLGDYKFLNNFYDILAFICSQEGDVVDCNDVSPLWKDIRNLFSSSTNIAAAYLGAVACRGVTILFLTNRTCESAGGEEKNDNLNDMVSSKTSEAEWETVNLDIEHWNALVKQLEDTIVLGTLLFFKLPTILIAHFSCLTDCDQPISVSYILEKGKGAISELVAKWSTSLHLDALVDLGVLSNIDQTDSHFFFQQEEFREITTDMFKTNIQELKLCTVAAKERFPQSLNLDVWVVNCCWEFAALWNKEKDNIQNLISAIKCLRQVSTSDYGKGLGMMLWHTFIRTTFLSAAALIEKVGKVPKDRLCQKSIGICESSLKAFVGCTVALFDILLQICSIRFSPRLSAFVCEEPWQSELPNSSLIDIVVSQKEPNYDLVCNYYQLALTVHTILTFGMKSTKPLSLNSAMKGQLLLKDLSAAAVIPECNLSHTLLNEKQMQFLCRAITAAVSTLSLPMFDDNCASTSSEFSQIELNRSRKWIGKIMELGNLWELDYDRLNRHYVCELYSSGLDTLAEEVLQTVADREVMASQLILLAGQRIYNAIQMSSVKYVELMSLFPPLITTWLTTLNQNALRCPDPPLSMTTTMIGYVINAIPEKEAEHKLALSLLEPLHQLINTIENSKNL